MAPTLSQIARTQLDQTWRAMDAVLAKGAAHAATRNVEENVYLGWRLAPDMYPLVRQVQLISDFAVGGMTRLAGAERPAMADDETGFEALRARIRAARDAVAALDDAAIDADPEAEISFPAGAGREMTLPRRAYLQNFVLANVLFHAATAYNILRSLGVELGKADIMGITRPE